MAKLCAKPFNNVTSINEIFKNPPYSFLNSLCRPPFAYSLLSMLCSRNKKKEQTQIFAMDQSNMDGYKKKKGEIATYKWD